MKNKVSRNIKCLRTSTNETQHELGKIIGVTDAAISKYERGATPEKSVLERIAKHYMTSVESLENDDFFDFSFKNFTYKDLVDFWINVFPIVHIKDSISNEYFKKAYDLHLKLIDNVRLGKENILEDFFQCLTLYAESFDESNQPESAANILWFLLLIGSSYLINDNDISMYTIKKFKDDKVNNKEYIKYCLLADTDFIDGKASRILERKEFIKDIEEIMFECMNILRNSFNYFDLYEYYLALFYINNCFNADLSFYESNMIGVNLMETLYLFKNKYAVNLTIEQRKFR